MNIEQVMVYKVTYESKDDGHRLVDSYWSFKNEWKAIERSEQLYLGHVVVDTLWQDKWDNYFKIQMDEIQVDVPHARRGH